MKSLYWLVVFFIALAVNLTGIFSNNHSLQLISKPLIIPSLIGWFLSGTHSKNNKLAIWIIIALIFSWLGDVLLIFQERDQVFFLAGLVSFLLAHISYIVFFHKIRLIEEIKS